MPDRGDERGRGGTRTLVTGILAGTEWHPATNPQEATQTARAARDLAVRLRPVLSKLAQAPRGGRRRDLEWLPAVEQLAVDAQYFASWWLPRLEGKSAQSWPSWSADGYADWVKRLDAQRLRTLEMVEGTAPVTRIASVTQLRRGKSAAADTETEPEAEQAPAPGAEEAAEPHSPARHAGRSDEEPPAPITPLRGPGAALMDAALMDMAGAPDVPGMRAEASEPPLAADETYISKVTPVSASDAEDPDFAASTAPPAPEAVVTITDMPGGGLDDARPLVPRVPPNQGPVGDDPDTTRIQRAPADSTPDSTPLGFDGLVADTSETALPRVPRTPPNQGPADAGSDARQAEDPDTDPDAGVGADILQIPRTPPNSGPADADLPHVPRAPVVSLVGKDDGPRVPRTPPISGPSDDDRLAAEDEAGATHIALAPVVPRASNASSASSSPAAPAAPAALGTGAEEQTRPLFRPEPRPTPPPSISASSPAPPASAPAASPASSSISASAPAAAAMAAGAASAVGSARGGAAGGSLGLGMYGSGGSSEDEFENFQPGSDLPPPVFPMTEPVEPVDRGRIVRYALAAVVLAALCVVAFVGLTQKSKSTNTAATPPATSSSSSTAGASTSDSASSASAGAVTAPTATDTPAPPSSTAPKPPASSASKPAPPSTSAPSSVPSTSAAPHSSAAPPPPPPTTHQQQPPASTGVRSLSVTSLAPDQTGSYNYVAHVHVTTSGTGTVTVTVTFAGTASSNSPGSTGAQSQSFTLSGKTSYDIEPQLDVHGMCTGSGSQPYIDAVASASGAGSSVAYASSPC